MQKLLFTFLIVILSCKASAAALSGGGGVLIGGWKPIINVNDPTVVNVGKFAVDEHNKEAHVSLQFVKLVKGEQQVVAGMNYNLTIAAADGGAQKNYVALIWDKPWEKFRQLVSFKGPV